MRFNRPTDAESLAMWAGGGETLVELATADNAEPLGVQTDIGEAAWRSRTRQAEKQQPSACQVARC
ncbi:hypothetical protein ACP70R_034296 [Stipagrostis hirtigluma subsp. patula]